MRKSTFGRHPSKQLNELYLKKNYQGANPSDAKVLFVGRDPNWAADIETQDMLPYVLEYLTDGIAFWEKNDIHHPFLLPTYRGDGKKYHRNFARLNIDKSLANEISFVELIGFPTTGMAGQNKKVFKEYLFSADNRAHLIQLEKILNDKDKLIFIAWGLIDDFKDIYKKTGLFKRLAEIDKRSMSRWFLNQFENIYIHTHFSDGIGPETIAKMEKKVKGYLT